MFHLRSIHPNFFSPNPKSEIWEKDILFEKGGSYLIKAPSGSGKSSLILFLSALKNDYSGEIEFDGQSISGLDQMQRSKLRTKSISTVFQDLRLLENLSVLDNLKLKAALNKVDEDEINDLIRFFELEGLKSQKIRDLSQGEKQRVAISRALLQDFEVLLLDEPFSHLNEAWHEKTWELITKKCRSLEATIFLTSLDGGEKMTLDKELVL